MKTPLGKHVIEGSLVSGSGDPLQARNPVTGLAIDPVWQSATDSDVDRACENAAGVARQYAASEPEARARLLDTIAAKLETQLDPIVARANAETAYDDSRLRGEMARTTAQLRRFAAVLRDGSAFDVRVDRTDTGLHFMRVGVGPVAVFAASNFPLAFSTAGGDTASALAAGCPVIVNGHPAHPGTGQLVADCVASAVADCGFPPGVFAWLVGRGHGTGSYLVRHPAIRAVGFTGSRAGGTALMKLAAQRPVPIPVYAEMSSVNPVFLLPAALASRAVDIADAFVQSLCLGCGQFCTNPGLVFAVQGSALDAFTSRVVEKLASIAPAPLLTDGIRAAYLRSLQTLANSASVETLSYRPLDTEQAVLPALFAINATQLPKDPRLMDEIFGPASLIVRCTSTHEMLQVAESLEGQLTASVHLEDADMALAQALLPSLTERAGRVICNDFPTGVRISDAMVHGGPYPATSDGRSTSVGTAAIERFLRPVSFQGVPDELLPTALQSANRWGLPRRET